MEGKKKQMLWQLLNSKLRWKVRVWEKAPSYKQGIW